MVLAKDDGLGREGWTSGDSADDGVGGQNTGLLRDGSVLRQGWWGKATQGDLGSGNDNIG